MFAIDAPGTLVAIRDSDPVLGEWDHHAFVPQPLGPVMPALEPRTFMVVADARAALAALDNTARQLPNPTLLRLPTLRREAQSTSALEGTYAPLADVLGLTRQTAVLAFQFGDGLSNLIIPTSGLLMAMLALARVPYGSWLRFVLPLVAQLALLSVVFLVVAVTIGYH